MPCQGPHSDWWTSDDPTERRAAAADCTDCSLIELCAAVADERRERWHVWAGHDRTGDTAAIRENRNHR